MGRRAAGETFIFQWEMRVKIPIIPLKEMNTVK